MRVFVRFMVLLVPGSLFAHGSTPDSADELWRSWAWEPGVLIPLAVSGWLYIRGVRRFWRQRKGVGVHESELWCFAAGWLTLVLALVSPLHPLGTVLFSAHMTQHELLMLVAAPLLVLGRPLVAFLKALPRDWSSQLARLVTRPCWKRPWQFLSHPLTAWLVHAAALWIWHIPALFDATIDDEFIHALQHSSFLFSALLFWWAVLQGKQRTLGYGLAVLFMFTTALQSGLLGALITLAGVVLYPAYVSTAPAWGLSPLQDQQLGGLIMWIPAGLVYVISGLVLFANWMRASAERTTAREALLFQPVTESKEGA